TCLIPIFAFQRVEGKMFSPLAYTLGFALLGALLFTLTLVPVLVSVLLKKDAKEKHNRIVDFFNSSVSKVFGWTFANKRLSFFISLLLLGLSMFSVKLLGTEFLPQLNEG